MSSTKADMVLVQLDRIKGVIDEAVTRLGMSPQPFTQFSGGRVVRVLPQEVLFGAAYNREGLQGLLDRVPEPPEQPTSRARHIGATSEASKARIEQELAGDESVQKPTRKGKAKAESAA